MILILLPSDILREIGLWLSWRDANNYFRISKRFVTIRKAGFWEIKTLHDYGEKYKTDFYKASFPNYLATRIKYLKEKQRKLNAPYQIDTFGEEYGEIISNRDPIKIILPSGEEVKVHPHINILEKLVDIIENYYKEKGIPYNQNIRHSDSIVQFDYIKVYELKPLDREDIGNLNRYRQMSREIEEISSKLVKYLKINYPLKYKTHAKNFPTPKVFRFAESLNIDDFRKHLSQIKDLSPGNLVMSYDSTIFTVMSYYLENEVIVKVNSKAYNYFSEYGLEFPDIFYKHMDEAGLTVRGIKKLYGLEGYRFARENSFSEIKERPMDVVTINLPLT